MRVGAINKTLSLGVIQKAIPGIRIFPSVYCPAFLFLCFDRSMVCVQLCHRPFASQRENPIELLPIMYPKTIRVIRRLEDPCERRGRRAVRTGEEDSFLHEISAAVHTH